MTGSSTGLGGARIEEYEWSLDERYGASVPEGSGVRLRDPGRWRRTSCTGRAPRAGLCRDLQRGAARARQARRVVGLGGSDDRVQARLGDSRRADLRPPELGCGHPLDPRRRPDRLHQRSGLLLPENCNDTLRVQTVGRASPGATGGEEDDPRLDLDDVMSFGREHQH